MKIISAKINCRNFEHFVDSSTIKIIRFEHAKHPKIKSTSFFTTNIRDSNFL